MSMRLKCRLSPDHKRIILYSNYGQKDLIKRITGRIWDRSQKVWTIPIERYDELCRLFPGKLELLDGVEQEYYKRKAVHDHIEKIKRDQIEIEERNIQGVNTEFFTHQKLGFAFLNSIWDNEGGILAYDMGLGKTLISIGLVIDWFLQGDIRNCLVVCPASLKYSAWAKELKKRTSGYDWVVVDGDPPAALQKVEFEDGSIEKFKGVTLREIQYQQKDRLFIITNYESFVYDQPKGIIPTIDNDWVVVLDECHRIKNPEAVTTQNLTNHCKNARKKILLTGTPLENKIEELWSLVDFCREGLLGTYPQYRDKYVELDIMGNPIGPRYEKLSELIDIISPFMFRKRKSETGRELPELTIMDYWVDMTKEQKKLYKNLRHGIIEKTTGEVSYITVLAQITRIQQLLDSPALLREVYDDPELPIESGKLKELPKILEDIGENKVLIFSQYREMTDILLWFLTEKLKIHKDKLRYIHGDTKPYRRAEYQDDFLYNNDVKIMLVTTAGNYGLNLYTAQYIICFDQLFNPQSMNQLISRVHREGAKDNITVIKLLTKKSYEEKKLKILEEKEDLFKAVVENDEEVLKKLLQNNNRKLTANELLNLI